jgi:sulfate adenylyltransferase subunit 1 (EFTu-like GTPase family)
LSIIPVSALYGDNVVEPSAHFPWYEGPTVLEALESSEAGTWTKTHARRAPADPVGAAPERRRAHLRRHGQRRLLLRRRPVTLHAGQHRDDHPGHLLRRRGIASRPTSDWPIDLDLADETDAGRGDLIATTPLPNVTKELTATICWFGEKPLVVGQRLRSSTRPR